jgi:NADH:ubiquinone oxidoreductase subunit 5 (subunit L)/multisubunit Na+/H+ antiporter MnhA subunit
MSLLATGIALAASAASTASAAAQGFKFDPASTLPWAVPAIVGAPVLGYVLILGSVRTRRAAANVAFLTLLVQLVATLLVAWARFRQPSPYQASYQWINIPVAFTGDQRFQGFGIDLSFQLDHVALAALVAVLVTLLCCAAWHRVAARGEQGPVRFQVNAVLLALGAAGVLVSGDAAELLAFWLLAGLATYLLLGHRWGTEGAGQRSRIALAVPFVGDVALLCGVGLLYSRFGSLTWNNLYPALTTTLGVGQKSLTAAALLLFAAVAVRACIWPFTAWLSGTVDAPAASVAMAAGVWPVLAGSLLLRTLPIVGAAGIQAPRGAAYVLGLAAVAGPALALVGVELRRSVLLATSGAVALTLLGMIYPASTLVAFTGLLAVALARTGALLAATTAAAAMRTVDIRAMGGAWSRMPRTAAALLLASVAVALGGLSGAALRPRSLAWIALGAGLALVSLAIFRVYFAVAHGELRRRRAFEPTRVRDAANVVTGAAVAASVMGLLGAALSFFTGWVGFLAAGRHDVAAVGTLVLWTLLPLAGAAIAGAVVLRQRDAGLELGARLGERLGAIWDLAGSAFDGLLSRPGQRAVDVVEDVGLPAVEQGVGRALAGSGWLAGRRLPWVPAVLGAAIVLAVAFGLLSSQGLGR